MVHALCRAVSRTGQPAAAFQIRTCYPCGNPSKKEFIEAFIKKNRYAKNVSFIFITDASALMQMFPHGSVPHDVWIGKNRKVEAVTSSEYITFSNVQAFANNQKFHFIHKNDNLSFNYEKPVEENQIQAYNNQLLSKTTFYKYLPGLNSVQSFYKNDSGYFVSLLNQPILRLYQFALSNSLLHFNRQTILEVKNTNRIVCTVQSYDEWMLNNAYCYEVVGKYLPSNAVLKANILNDLNSNLGLYGRLEKRSVTFYKIICGSSAEKDLKSTGGTPEIQWNDKKKQKYLHNQKISMLTDYLNGAKTERSDVFQFSNEADISYNVDIELSLNDVGDIDSLTRQLRQYGLDLVTGKKEMEVFVLSDSN